MSRPTICGIVLASALGFVGWRRKYSFERNLDASRRVSSKEWFQEAHCYRESRGGFKIVGYYTNWCQDRPDGTKFYPKNIEVALCTHLIYAFAKIEHGVLAPHEENDKRMYATFNDLKKTNPGLKTLLAVGGGEMGSKSFSKMVSSPDSRKKFIDHSIDFLRKSKFDGLDVDWEFPSTDDRDNFTLFLQELHAAFAKESSTTGRERLLLTVAVAVGKKCIDTGYDVAEISKVVDFISLMAYDFHGSWGEKTGLNSPLYKRSGETVQEQMFNQHWAVEYWKQKGAPAEKIVLGLAAYGRSFTLSNPNNHDVGAAATGPGQAGNFTKKEGILSYYEICRNRWTSDPQDEQVGVYAYQGDQWVGYDNPKTMKTKARYIRDNGLGGAMLWSLNMDDFEKTYCQKREYPLLKAIASVLKS